MSERRSIINRFFLVGALLAGARAEAQAPMAESQVKAMFVYNFLKFVEWPVAEPAGSKDPFVVTIIGDGETADATEHFLLARSIGDRPLVVRRIRWDEPLAGVHAALVVETDGKKLQRVLGAAAAAGVLTIGEGESFTTRGGIIGLLVEGRKVRFDVDTTAARTAGLRISSKLLALTRVVRSSPHRDGSQQ